MFQFDNSYARLPAAFHAKLAPTPVASPRLLCFNVPLAAELGLEPAALEPAEVAAIFSGNTLPEGSEPLAMAYAGHQFGHFVPQLGDGRAILLGEVIDRSGQRRDIQLKGAGQTPFSRRGDGRSPLGPVLREYLVSEAMHALGIPTTRALAAVASGELVYREEALPGAVLTRVAASHVRIGTFEYFAAREDAASLTTLTEYVIDRHYPAVRAAPVPALALLAAVMEAQASLVAHWMGIGFIHGVMNTDNMAIAGETIDYGPCAFMDHYDQSTVFSSIDSHGRYAYGNQPGIAHWNLARLAACLLPLIDPQRARAVELANAVLEEFPARFRRAWLAVMRRKLGLATAADQDEALAEDLLAAMQAGGADFTLGFRALSAAELRGGEQALRSLFSSTAALDAWLPRWRARLADEPHSTAERQAAMLGVNPARIPRNHAVEAVLAAAAADELGPFEALLDAVRQPFASSAALARWDEPPGPEARVYQTFCGT